MKCKIFTYKECRYHGQEVIRKAWQFNLISRRAKSNLYSNLSLYLHPDSENINSKHYLQRGSCTVYLYKDALMLNVAL